MWWTTLKLLAGEIHPKLALLYDGAKDKPYILSGGGTFLIALLAACEVMSATAWA